MDILKVFWHLNALLKIFFYKIIFGNKLRIRKNVTFRKGFSLLVDGGNISIGNNMFFYNYCSIVSHESIIIGDNCIFGENVKIYDYNHKFNNNDVKNQGFCSKDIKIGENCWLVNNVILLKWVEIGDNSVIGASWIIKEKIPDNVVVTVKYDFNILDIYYK